MTEPVDYSPEKFPCTRPHCDTLYRHDHILRFPKGADEAGLAARGIRRVMDNLGHG